MTRWARFATAWVCTSLLLGCSKPGYDSEPAASEGETAVEEEREPQGAEKSDSPENGEIGDEKREHSGEPLPASPGDNVIENTQPEKNLANQPGYEYAPGKGPSTPPPDAGPDAENN